MTNLEFYKDEIKRRAKDMNLGSAICLLKNEECGHCGGSDGYCIKCSVVDWLCEEHKEPIKLKQWEYDFLNIIQYKEEELRHLDFCIVLKGKKGHFKGITDTTMTLEEILDNCIIVADDYEGFESTKCQENKFQKE